MKTKVKFLLEFADVLAVFPGLDEGSGTCRCYSVVGQHSACNVEYAMSLPEATPEQYAEVKQELEGAPFSYELDIINTVPAPVALRELTIDMVKFNHRPFKDSRIIVYASFQGLRGQSYPVDAGNVPYVEYLKTKAFERLKVEAFERLKTNVQTLIDALKVN